jgi:hypothetical protein
MYHEKNKPIRQQLTVPEGKFIIKITKASQSGSHTKKWSGPELKIIESLRKKRYISKTKESEDGLTIWCNGMIKNGEEPKELVGKL